MSYNNIIKVDVKKWFPQKCKNYFTFTLHSHEQYALRTYLYLYNPRNTFRRYEILLKIFNI